MFKIDKHNRIFLTKGDNAEIDIRIYNLDGKEVEITSNDTIVLTVRKNTSQQSASFSKTADLNTIYIEPADTSSLSSGLYVYDIQLTNADGEISTIIPVSYFELLEEVSR